MSNKLTPVRVEVLLHYFYRTDDITRTPAYQAAEGWLAVEGAFENSTGANTNRWQLTPVGLAWVRAILKTLKPKQIFVDARGEEV